MAAPNALKVRPRVAVVITTYNHSHFLGEAIASVLDQTRVADQIIVVDDGSDDDPPSVVSRFPGVSLVKTTNGGLASARNVGLNLTDADYVTFLDADDRLTPRAIEAGLACMAANPGAAFVYGAHRRIDAGGRPLGPASLHRASSRGFLDLLKANVVAMHATALYDRERLVEVGAFDASLRRSEDYDVFLRMASLYRIACHDTVVADYRWHGSNMSADAVEMLVWSLRVHDRHRPDRSDADAWQAWRQGRRLWKRTYANFAWRDRPGVGGLAKWAERARIARMAPASLPMAAARQLARKLLPQSVMDRIRRSRGETPGPPLGGVDMGDLTRLVPISRDFGFDRGTPIDRHYIAGFLARHASDVRGRVLEVGDATYSRRFGAGAISRQDVIHVDPGAPDATIVGDLAQAGLLEADAFDCMIIAQTLHLIYPIADAVRELHRALRADGVLLATVPGISPIDRGEWGGSWYWSLTRQSAERLFADAFGADRITVEVHGNVFAATAFLHGLAVEEINPDWLEYVDPAMPVTISVRAVK